MPINCPKIARKKRQQNDFFNLILVSINNKFFLNSILPKIQYRYNNYIFTVNSFQNLIKNFENWLDSIQQSFHSIWQPGYWAWLLASLPWYSSNSHGSISFIFMFTVKTVVHMLLIPNLEKCLVHPGIKHKNERGQAIFIALVINSKNKYTYKNVTVLIFALNWSN